MGYGSDSGSQDGKDEDDEEDDYEETGGSNRLLGFMFGNVDNSGDLDVDYLDEDAKEHLSALADKLGSSLTDIDLSVKLSHRSSDAVEDYDEKAEDAVDYEDIDEQYEGPEVQALGEEDYILPKKDYIASEVSLAILKPSTSVFDDEDYDEEVEPQNDIVDNASDAQTTVPSDEQVKLHEADSGGEKLLEDDHHLTGSTDAETSNSGLEDFEGELSDKSSPPLPVLCIEDGKAILRFTELFGTKDRVRKREKREHKTSRVSFKATDVFNNVEDDEEDFFTGSGPGFISLKREDFDQYEHEMRVFHDDESDSEKSGVLQGIDSVYSKDICFPSEPMKRDLDHSIGRLSPLSTSFYPLDQLDWEVGIVWDNSPSVSENHKISRPDTEASVDSEAEHESPQSPLLKPRVEPGDKPDEKFLHSSPVILEQFGSRTLLEGRYHPQPLRLESRSEVDNSDQDEGRAEKVSEKKLHRTVAIENYNKLVSHNRDMDDGSWLDDIIWDQSGPVRKAKLILDLQDEHMLFEILDSEDGKNLMLHSGAMFTTRSVKSSNGDSPELPGHLGQFGWRSVANDKHYSSRKASQQMKANSKKRTTQGVKIYHSQPALTLQTMKVKLSNKELANFHRPKALWYPHDNEVAIKELAKLSTRGPMKVVIKSLSGKGIKLQVDAEETVSAVKAKASKKLAIYVEPLVEFKPSEPVKLFYRGKELEDDKTLSAQNVQPNSLVHLVRTRIHLLPRAQKLPGENKSLRPPGAFKKKSDLSVKDGHVFLMEYCEERPLLLSNIGMGARLCTYYQKSAQDDQTASLLRSTDKTLGHVIALNPADKSPFLGDIKPGSSQSSLETNMYRAPVFSHKVPSTDYLLIRSPKGKISLRRIDRLSVVGQQEPLMEVMSPGSKNLQNYMLNRLLVHVSQVFRAAEKNELLPSIRADVLASQFPHLSDVSMKKKLKDYAYQQRVPNSQLMWVKKRGFRISTEEELRNIVKPEEVCAYESMQAGLYRLKHMGITETHPTAVLSSMNRLPDEALALAAASHIERELQITPWNLSSNFVASTQGKENIERMEIIGVGDPTGRGLGFSYVRAITKAPVTNAVAKKKAAGAGRVGTTVTGTDADLRRLSMEAARELLLKFDVQDEVIAKQGRWHRIAMIRKLSSEQAEAGVKVDPSTISKYARGQRMSFLQLQHQAREKCLEIWDRQFQSLSAFEGDENESECEEGNNSDLDSFAGDLENLLDAEECEEDEGEDGNFDSGHDKSDGVKGLKMRKRPTLVQAEEELEDEAAEATELCRLLMDGGETDKKKKKKPKSIGEKSVFASASRPNFSFDNNIDHVKQITMANPPGGSYVPKENIIGETKVEIILKKNKPGKIKPKIKNEVIPTVTLTNTKIKIAGEIKHQMFKEKKSARESFICGACGQLGHMRTNKNCPKYGDPEAHAETQDSEKVASKAAQFAPTQTKTVTKKLIPKGATKIALVETSEGENYCTTPKVVPLKFKCGTTDKTAEKLGPTRSSDQPVTSDSETGKSTVKINKIIISNKLKQEEQKFELYKPPIVIRPPAEIVQIEPQKPTIVIRPPASLERDRFEITPKKKKKKIVIKRPKETVDLDPFGGGDGGEWSGSGVKTKRMVELSSFEFHRKPEKVSFFSAEASDHKTKSREKRKWLEEEERERKRNEERERRAREEQEKLDEIRRYEVSLRREREEEEMMRAQQKKTKKKRTAVETREVYLNDDSALWRFDQRIPERDRSVKRRPVVDHGRSSSDFGGVFAKRRRGGEVGLANILEHIVETLKERKEVSYLFMKPVTKKEAPDYLRVIDRPMDLSTIKEKVRKMEYKSREQFRHDVWQIAYNAHRYNDGRNPGIPPLADQLLEICDYLLNENDESLTEAESGIESRDF